MTEPTTDYDENDVEPESNFECVHGNEHQWPSDLDSARCEVCGLPYDEWSEPDD